MVSYEDKISDGVHSFVLDRKKVYINNKEPDGMFYELADKMRKSLSTLFITINKERKIVSINNYQAILERSNNAIEKIKKYYVGEYAEKYIVCQGAICMCKFGGALDKQKVLSHQKEFINDPESSQKLIATTMDIESTFEKNCFVLYSKLPYSPSCVASVIQW